MPKRLEPTRIILLAALISAVAAFALYIPSLGFDFVSWDDHKYVYENPRIQAFDIKWAFTSVVVSTWVPLTLLSFALDHAVWGLNPFGYHLTNSVFHSANVFLVAFLAARLARTRSLLDARSIFIITISAGLLFGLHPLRVESVAWVSERKDVLNAFFFLLGLHAYLTYAEERKSSAYILSLVLFTLSLLSKPMTVTMPLVLLILDYYPLDRIKTDGWRKILLEKFPFLILSFASGLITVWSQTEAIVPVGMLPFEGRLHVAARGYLFYIYKTLLPVNLVPLYPRDFDSGFNLLFALYILALSVGAALVLYLRKWSKAYVSACAYFAITLMPVIGFLQVGKQAAADRYTYLPGISLALLVAAGAGWAVMKKRKMFIPMLAALALISGLLSFLTFRQEIIWKDSISLWSHQVSVYPDYDQGYVNRGNSYLAIGQLDLAMQDLSRRTPNTALGFMNRANAYISLGKLDQAIENFNKAIELGPVPMDAYMKRGSALITIGRIEEGITDLDLVLDSEPRHKAAYRARGTAYAVSGRYGNALEDFRKAVEIDPADPSAHIDLGKVYMHLGDNESSYISMKKALALGDPGASRYLEDLYARGAGRRE